MSDPPARIEPWAEDDGALLARLLGDPAMMEHLGGPESEQQIADRHVRYLAHADRDPQFRIMVGQDPAGWVGYWEREWREREVYEIGWSVLPAFQGRGVARAATEQAIAHARAHGRRRLLHAFPSVDNAPSNAICSRTGFTLLGPCDFEYPPGHPMRCNDWRLDLRDAH